MSTSDKELTPEEWRASRVPAGLAIFFITFLAMYSLFQKAWGWFAVLLWLLWQAVDFYRFIERKEAGE